MNLLDSWLLQIMKACCACINVNSKVVFFAIFRMDFLKLIFK